MESNTNVGQDYVEARSQRAKRHWDEIWSNAVIAKRNWQLMAFGELAVIVVQIFWIGHLAGQPKAMPFVLDRDSSGSVHYAGILRPINMTDQAWDKVKIEALKRFLGVWRTVTMDRSVVQSNWDESFLFIGGNSQAYTAISEWYRDNDPLLKLNKGELVSTRFQTWERGGANTYGLWWEENTTNLQGTVTATKHWHMRVVYSLDTKHASQENSLGLLITELTWEEVRQ